MKYPVLKELTLCGKGYLPCMRLIAIRFGRIGSSSRYTRCIRIQITFRAHLLKHCDSIPLYLYDFTNEYDEINASIPNASCHGINNPQTPCDHRGTLFRPQATPSSPSPYPSANDLSPRPRLPCPPSSSSSFPSPRRQPSSSSPPTPASQLPSHQHLALSLIHI